MSASILEIRDLKIGYKSKTGDKCVLSGMNATLNAGELTCLLGPNGAGKSTLLRTLCGFQDKLSGEIYLKGKSLETYTTQELAQLESVVLTDSTKANNLTVYDVITLGRSPYTGFWGNLQKEDKEKVDQSIEMVGIEQLVDKKMSALSDGECQKVMIAKTIAQETPLILLDEPTAYLDYPSKVQTMLLLRRLAKELDKSIFMSTHDLEHALQSADNIWLVDQKRGLTTGTPEDLTLNGEIEEYFNREGIAYNGENFSFDIENTTHTSIKVEGDTQSLAYKLCCKALSRNGIQPTTETTTDRIEVKENTFNLTKGDKVTENIRNIGELVKLIVNK